ncbi:bifunctional Phosphatidylinositol 4-kinase gamma 1-8/Phosphatidylinositol 3--4-kinase [Babesia duncani]|uniref:Bifunctional Phosphatidylinositol 4-kinase gamma 1-8/Phosphatidylinositol 3--4-kinase n=1 Tax=Babesia duncani TaxID=323732 RepID=A0AAD9PH25_9APIC|nr:bifunctional Phosphatidylinositol 4-kinase gamma 1-8/Phosphatidylinositol 3--4-kinase [Babesia duncani]KAK2196560.1 bifunctional Phosphatidylinositol 4-kinase gamma 1-8/Phosphatidylinositol 3--4-kinase [Babesia duncani]
MSSGVLRISQQNYFSTHNALQEGAIDDSAVRFVLHELNGERHGALRIFPFYDVQMVKRLLIKKLSLPRGTLVKDLRILYKGLELPNYRTMDSYINHADRSNQRLYWCLKEINPTQGIRPSGIKVTAKLQRLISDVSLSMKHNIKPKLTMDGTGGTYLLYNKHGKCCAIFKPIDEEAFTPFNPRGYQGKMYQHGFRSGVLSGEGASREVAAYLLDAAYGGACGVPDTTMVEASHSAFNNSCDAKFIQDLSDSGPKWKTGSLQEFIDCHESSGDYHPGLFNRHDVHRIGILDLRVLNLDRNDGNILVQAVDEDGLPCLGIDQDCKLKLIPIDHGLILPDVIDVTTLDLVWYDWPQALLPFYKSELDLIYALDPDKDAERLHKRLLIRTECLRTMRVTVRLLQIGSSMHLNLRQIAKMALRHDLDVPSELECLVKTAIEYAFKATDATSLISSNRFGVAMDVSTSLEKVAKRLSAATVATGDDLGEPDALDENDDDDDYDNYDETTWDSETHSYETNSPGNHNQETQPITYKTLTRTTYRRRLAQSMEPSIWTLLDSRGRPIHIDWDAQFEHCFYSMIEKMFYGYIAKQYPNWESLPYNGSGGEVFSWSHRQVGPPLALTRAWFQT